MISIFINKRQLLSKENNIAITNVILFEDKRNSFVYLFLFRVHQQYVIAKLNIGH